MVRKGYVFRTSITRYRQLGCKYWIWGGPMQRFHHLGPSCFGTLPQSLKTVIQLMRNVSWLLVLHPHLVARINWYNMINMSTWQGQELQRYIEGQYKLWLVRKKSKLFISASVQAIQYRECHNEQRLYYQALPPLYKISACCHDEGHWTNVWLFSPTPSIVRTIHLLPMKVVFELILDNWQTPVLGLIASCPLKKSDQWTKCMSKYMAGSRYIGGQYRVTRQVSDLGWVDSDLACSLILPGQ